MPDPSAPDALPPLTPVVFHILAALAGEIRHGYAIAGEVERASGGAIHMGPGTLYGSLQRMRDDGLVAEAEDPGREGIHAQRRRYYRVTDPGRDALAAETDRLARAAALGREALGTSGGGG